LVAKIAAGDFVISDNTVFPITQLITARAGSPRQRSRS
jgi:hypothetical protein